MDIIISNADGRPIYEQIYSAVKEKIISGEIKAGEPLPSIRALAKDLRISVITTKRAYDELERDGYIFTIAGKGSFAAEKNTELIKEEYLKRIEEYMREIDRLAVMCGIGRQELMEMYDIIKKENTGESY